MIEAVAGEHLAVAVPPLAGFTAAEEPKPESRIEVTREPVYTITTMEET